MLRLIRHLPDSIGCTEKGLQQGDERSNRAIVEPRIASLVAVASTYPTGARRVLRRSRASRLSLRQKRVLAGSG